MGGKSGQTIGYHYLMSMLSGLWRGPVNDIVAIKVGDKIAWSGHAAVDGGLQTIDKPDLFGGEKKEGGIQGGFRVFMGAEDQVLPTAVDTYAVGAPLTPTNPLTGVSSSPRAMPAPVATIGGRVSALRGVVTVWFDGLVCSMNPYPKEWKYRGRRSTAGWYNDDPWYPEKATIFLPGEREITRDEAEGRGLTAIVDAILGIPGATSIVTYVPGAIHAMNPAHILYECITNPLWGRGLPATALDENSFIYSANTFCTEGLGLCLTWFRTDDLDVFMQSVIDHAGAALYTDKATGLLTLRPIRKDYAAADLPLFTLGSGLLDIEEDDSSAADAAYNEVVIKGHDPISDTDFDMRAQNLGALQEAGSPNTLTLDRKGFPTRDLAGRAAARELKVHASGLKKFKVSLDRRAWKLAPASCFRIYAPHRGLGYIILRVGEILENGLDSGGEVQVKAMEDVFGMPDTSLITVVPTTWLAPGSEALPPVEEEIVEAGYRDVLLVRGASDADAMADADSVLMVVAAAPNVSSTEYDLYTKADGDALYLKRATGFFTGTALLDEDITPLQTVVAVTGLTDVSAMNEGQALLLGDEIVELSELDTGAGTMTLKRGCADTIPQAHVTGARLWTVDDDATSDARVYVEGETAQAKVLTRTSSDVLTLAEAAELSITFQGRVARPFPPGDLKVDGTSVYALDGAYPEPTFTFTHRDRKLQADHLVGHVESDVGPEAGTTYNIRFFEEDGVTLIHEETGITTSPWQFTALLQAPYSPIYKTVVEVASERDGLESYQVYRFEMWIHAGWDDLWGGYWDGA